MPVLDIDSYSTITPEEAGRLLDSPVVALRVRQLLVLAEILRQPYVQEQFSLIESFCHALGGDDEGLLIIRGILRGEAEKAVEHLKLRYRAARSSISDQTVLERVKALEGAVYDCDLASKLRAMCALKRGTLGREYIELYLANDFLIPGEGCNNPALFVWHDMSHLIAGLPPTILGELCLSAFQLGMRNDEDSWINFLADLCAYEMDLKLFSSGSTSSLALKEEGAFDAFLESYVRGRMSTRSYHDCSLFDLAEYSIADVRTIFGIPAPKDDFPAFTG